MNRAIAYSTATFLGLVAASLIVIYGDSSVRAQPSTPTVLTYKVGRMTVHEWISPQAPTVVCFMMENLNGNMMKCERAV